MVSNPFQLLFLKVYFHNRAPSPNTRTRLSVIPSSTITPHKALKILPLLILIPCGGGLSYTYSPPSPICASQTAHICVARCWHTSQGAHIAHTLYSTDSVIFRGQWTSSPKPHLFTSSDFTTIFKPTSHRTDPHPQFLSSPSLVPCPYCRRHRPPGYTARTTTTSHDTQTLLH